MAFLNDFKESLDKKLRGDMRTPLLQGEEIIDSQTGACAKVGLPAALGGTIFFTNRRIVFETNKVSSKIKEIVEIVNVSDVLEFCRIDKLGIGSLIPVPGLTKDKSVVIRTADTGYCYAPNNPDSMIQNLKNICPNAKLVEKSGYIDTLKNSFMGWKGTSEQSVSNCGEVRTNTSGAGAESKDPVDEIKRYKELLDIGVITQEEFDTKKKELLN